MNMFDAIRILEGSVSDPSKGLPDEIFYYISSVTPLINVDLLIKDDEGRVLLAWRDDEYAGTGWHLPGGIIRFKERIEDRLHKVAKMEVGVEANFGEYPVTIREIMHETRAVRGHFISLLYECSLIEMLDLEEQNSKEAEAGFLQWHDKVPEDILSCHVEYGDYC